MAAPLLEAAPREEEAVGEPEPEPELEVELEPEPEALGEVALAEEPEAVVVLLALPDGGVPDFLTSNSWEVVKI